MLIPLDMHAHIEPDISSAELDRLGACVVAVTRSLPEYEAVAARQDRSVVWALGCHPGLAKALRGFSVDVFGTLATSAAIVGEVGLDGAARVPMATQQAVFDDVLSGLARTPRIVSVHSYRATGQVLQALERHRPHGIVLHWWLGDEEQTRRAVALGAYFSINASQVSRWPELHRVPLERLLTETDHPFGDRREPPPRRPGGVTRVERHLGETRGLAADEVRRTAWQNLGRIADDLHLHELLPHQFQVQLLAA